MATEDPLRALLVDDADDLDRAAIAAALRDLTSLDAKTGDVRVRPSFNDLSSRGKIMGYLLAAKVAELLEKRPSALVSPKEIVDNTGMAPGTVRPTLSKLADKRMITRSAGGAYTVAPHQISHAIEALR